jgi:hypothetical protein
VALALEASGCALQRLAEARRGRAEFSAAAVSGQTHHLRAISVCAECTLSRVYTVAILVGRCFPRGSWFAKAPLLHLYTGSATLEFGRQGLACSRHND